MKYESEMEWLADQLLSEEPVGVGVGDVPNQFVYVPKRKDNKRTKTSRVANCAAELRRNEKLRREWGFQSGPFGAVLNVGHGLWQWFPQAEWAGSDLLVKGLPVEVIERNEKAVDFYPKRKSPQPIDRARQPGRETHRRPGRRSVVATPDELDAYLVLGRDGDALWIKHNDQYMVATVVGNEGRP